MADENKPAFYPRVGNIKAKNFKSAQPMPFIDDPRAMELPRFGEDSDQFGRVDVGVASQQNLELGRRMVERENQLRRQREADRSPLEKLAGGVQAGRFLGSAMTQGINSIPTRLVHGDEAADKFIQERIYKPEQPLAYEYAQDVGDFLEKLETEYKIPPVLPEAVALQYLTGPATSQAMRVAGKGVEQAGRAVERSMEPVVKGALERGGLPREMVMAMGANTQSNVIKPYGGNWLGGGKGQIVTPEGDLQRLKTSTFVGETPAERIPKHEALLNDPTLNQDQRDRVQRMLDQTKGEAAVDKWIDSNLTNYVKKEMGTRDDPVRKLAEEGIVHTPLNNDPDRMEYLQAIRKAEGYPAEGMGKSALAKQWENISDDAIRVTKAGKIQDAATIASKLEQARTEMDAYSKELNKKFLARMSDQTGKEIFSPKEAEMLTNMQDWQKADILGDPKYSELKENLYGLMAREQGFEKRAGEANPFVSKLDPETRLYSGSTYDLGFDHIIDVLREDVAAGRIRPEQLNKVSMEQAVRRTFEYDQELAKKMDAARLTARAELPVYKEYPEGLKWVELNRPGDFAAESDAMGHSVRGYEPPEGSSDWTKGSGDSGYSGYGLGGWEAIKKGKAKVYSLIDAKGEPHVTIEVGAYPDQLRAGNLKPYTQAALEEAKLLPNGYTDADVRDIEIRMAKENMPKYINQIKGKQNAKPKEEYLPFVQDFVRGGNWSDVRDFQNTDLISADKIRQAGWDMTGVDKKYLTKQEYDDLLLNELNKPKGMKRGGKVGISKNPDTMMLEVNNQKMKNGVPAYGAGKAVTKMGLKAAKNEVPRLAMQFGNDLPLNMADDLIKRSPSVDRINMNYKDVTKRVPELTEAAQKLQAGELDRETYAKLVQALKPVKPYDFVPKPATADEARGALKEDARDTYGVPSQTLAAGHPVGLRLDIPAYTNKGVWVPTVHEQDAGFGAGKKIGHESVASVLNPEFGMSEKAALSIATGKPKGTIATIKGDWNPTSEADIIAKAKEYLKHPEWRQVGMDPERHSYFYDRETMAPVVNAEEVIQIGPLVLAKNPKFGKPEDFKYASGGLAHMKEGGSEDDAKPYFGGAGTKKYAAAKKRAEQGDVNTLRDPKTYATVAGFFGERPDEMGFSVMHPDYQGVREAADPAFYAGTALGVAPLMKVFKAPAMALGRAGERYAEKVVPQIMERGGVGADMLGGLAQGTRSNIYLPHTPQKPDPNVGSRYKTQHVGNLAPKREFDIEANQDSSVMANPWDLTSRGEKVLEVSDTPMINPIVTEGGHDFARDLANIQDTIGGASGRQIAERMQDRVNDAYFANMMDKGSGRVFTMPSTMDYTGSNYSTMPTDVIMDFFKQAELKPKDVNRITDDLRTFMFETERGKFKNAAPVGSPDFMRQLREGGEGFSAGDLRKGFMDRMSKAEYQKMLGYNIEDVYAAIHDPALKGVPKGFVGNTMIETSPFAEIRPSTHQSYDSANAGKYAGSMPSMPIELMMPDLYEYLERQVLSSPKPTYKNMTPNQIRTMIINMIEKRGSVISQPINQRVVDNVMRYKEGLKQGHFKPNDYESIMEFMRRTGGYKDGGAVNKAEGGYIKKPAAYINGDEFVNAAKKYGIKDSMNNLNKIVDLVNKGLSVDDAARQVADTGMHKAAGGAIRGDDLILEERPL